MRFSLGVLAPINSKLQHPPPRCLVPGKGGIWTLPCKGGEFESGLISCSGVIFRTFFRFLQGFTNFQDRISPLLVNNSFKRVFKRRLMMSSRHISPWKACTVYDWRRNLSFRRVIAILIGGVFQRLFCPDGGNFNDPTFKSSNAQGGMLKFRIERCIIFEITKLLTAVHSNYLSTCNVIRAKSKIQAELVPL